MVDTVDKLKNLSPNEIVKIKESFLNSLAEREIYSNPRSKATTASGKVDIPASPPPIE